MANKVLNLKKKFVANAFIHIKSLYTQQHCYVSLKTLYPGGIRTRVFSFLRRMRCPLLLFASYFLQVTFHK
jgi:hypothetical protein